MKDPGERGRKKLLTEIVICLLVFSVSITSFGIEDSPFKSIYLLYKKGAYLKALKELNNVEGGRATQATVSYWKGLCRSRLQQFDKAVDNFSRAARFQSQATDLYYEKGQAEFASQKMSAARESFRMSVKKGYKPNASRYYVGYASQILEDDQTAIKNFRLIEADESDTEKVKQAALFQIAEINLKRSNAIKEEAEQKTVLKKVVIPSFEKTVEFNEKSSLAREASGRIRQIKSKFFPVKLKPWTLRFSEDIDYDTNVVSQADEATVILSQTDSLVFKTGITSTYKMKLPPFVLKPEFAFKHNYHSRQDVGKVHQNDQYSFTPAVKSTVAHNVNKETATVLFDTEFSYVLKDHRGEHRFPFYTRHWKVTLGDRAKLFKIGSTTLKVSYKILHNQALSSNSRTSSVDLSQTIDVGKSMSVSAGTGADISKVVNSDNNLNTYKANFSLTVPTLFWKITPAPSFNLTLTDPVKQRPARGLEKTYNPGVRFSRSFGGFNTSLNYSFTKKTSRDKTAYAYVKHVVSLGFAYTL